MKTLLSLICGSAIALSACAPALMDSGRTPLSGSAIINQFPGHTLIGGIKNEAGPWATYVQRNGLALFRAPDGQILETEWAVAGDRFCYSDVGGVEKICMTVYRTGNGYQFVDENGRESVYASKKSAGDALNLSGFLDSQRTVQARSARAQQLEERRRLRTETPQN